MNKNLEAENEVFKGMFRTPFAFVIGSFPGLLANTVYTTIKAKQEIDRENHHKKFVESQFDIKIERDKYFAEKRNKKQKEDCVGAENNQYLMNEFLGANDLSFNEYSQTTFFTKEKFPKKDRHYRVSIKYGPSIFDSFGANYLPEFEFIEKYNCDKNNGVIEEKYTLYNNNIRITFCYKTKDGYYCTGMYTQI